MKLKALKIRSDDLTDFEQDLRGLSSDSIFKNSHPLALLTLNNTNVESIMKIAGEFKADIYAENKNKLILKMQSSGSGTHKNDLISLAYLLWALKEKSLVQSASLNVIDCLYHEMNASIKNKKMDTKKTIIDSIEIKNNEVCLDETASYILNKYNVLNAQQSSVPTSHYSLNSQKSNIRKLKVG